MMGDAYVPNQRMIQPSTVQQIIQRRSMYPYRIIWVTYRARLAYNYHFVLCNPCTDTYHSCTQHNSRDLHKCEFCPSYMHIAQTASILERLKTNHLPCPPASHLMPTENNEKVVLSSFLRHVIGVRERCLARLLETLGSIQSMESNSPFGTVLLLRAICSSSTLYPIIQAHIVQAFASHILRYRLFPRSDH